MRGVRSETLNRPPAAVVAGAVLWFVGVSPAQRVYLTQDPAARLAILEKSGWRWVAGQHLTAVGTAVVPVAFAGLAAGLPHGKARKLAGLAAASLLAGAPLFVWCLADRASDLERFAYRRGASWPFLTYSWLHVAGLAALAGALACLPAPRGAVVAAAASAPVFGTVLAANKDIPPFVFYAVEAGVAASLLRRQAGQ
ncbi:hypothetical protein [Arthrobacter sp. CJ23]|uniref:hypothetical protein n=1 Tax=Arthrobacter sp. CJ23 TaxID=2972479 RepID=UPI00215C83B5|nr:hypothetical protein [Arthrobacter sp. CJ23]UVJ41065.1 hypothetical protein NVV90_07870 [Arthrobacter sp. CJ23]